jgi:hypothetical protein
MRYHLLKTTRDCYDALRHDLKKFEFRQNDRDFKVGDLLLLALYDPKKDRFEQDDFVDMQITYILASGEFGLPQGMCILSLRYPWVPAAEINTVYRHMRQNNLTTYETP